MLYNIHADIVLTVFICMVRIFEGSSFNDTFGVIKEVIFNFYFRMLTELLPYMRIYIHYLITILQKILMIYYKMSLIGK